ncbi:MAG: hypothetical protein N4A72_10970 [Bacteroidales bacterium]|jgi:hypothetical protein|nr:hypothetical protein [Bacteroidales bacterium]
MRKLKLSLKKDIISDLENKEVKGGVIYSENMNCRPKTYELSRCLMCDKTQELTCMAC